MKLIATEQIIYKSPSPQEVFCFSPSIAVLHSGRILAGFDFGGPGVAKLPGVKTLSGDYNSGNQGKILASDDGGVTWEHLSDLAMYHARLFVDGKRVYFLGHDHGITVSASDDEGKTWTDTELLDDSCQWHQSPCAVHMEEDYVYLTMEKKVGNQWPDVAPVMMRGKRGTDLTKKENWTFSNTFLYPQNMPTTLGIPFYVTGALTPDGKDKRYCGPPCFLESHVVKIRDKGHLLYDENALHIWMRQHSGLTNIAAIAKCKIKEDGSMEIGMETTPAGSPIFHVPFPGGHMKFDVCYDEKSKYYWLVTSQPTDSMTRPALLPDDRYNIPDNERHRLALYFSTNMFDWCFAGMVAMGKTNLHSRHYASMAIYGDSLLILSRSGDENARTAHNGNLLTLHTVENFRELIY